VSQTANPAKTKLAVQAAWISFIASLIIFGLKIWAVQITQSVAIFSDAMESVVNIVASLVALVVTKAVAEPADEKHPYGHGKLEYFSAAFEGGLIAFAAIAIGIEGIRALLYGRVIGDLGFGMLVILGASLLNLILGLYLKSVSAKVQSETLKASSVHVLSDVWTTGVILLGLLLIQFVGPDSWVHWLDPMMAIIVAGNLGKEGWKIARKSVGALIDEQDPKSLSSFAEALSRFRKPWVIDVHNLRMIRSGQFHHIDAHIVVPEYWDIVQVHEAAEEYEKQVVKAYDFEGEIAFHVDPCGKKYCENCAMPDCPIRLSPFVKQRELNDATIIQGPSY
jgi:cation diffusion facilitator family transporter